MKLEDPIDAGMVPAQKIVAESDTLRTRVGAQEKGPVALKKIELKKVEKQKDPCTDFEIHAFVKAIETRKACYNTARQTYWLLQN